MPHQFPDITRLEKGKDATPIFGGGLGTNKIYDVLRTTAMQPTSPRWNLWLINVLTLARNAGLDKTPKERESSINRDADLCMTFIGAYTNFRQQTPAVVLFYAPDYSGLPTGIRREHTGQQLALDLWYQQFRLTLPPKLVNVTETPPTQKFLIALGRETWPHRLLIPAIRGAYNNGQAYGTRGTVLISHCALDLHLVKTIPDLELLESYTGQVVPPAQFGRKLTKAVAVPFNTITHRLFGDDLHLQPLLTGTDRTKLIQLATEHRWMLKTETEILNDALLHFPKLTREVVTQYRF